jgi:hypothetical protein
MSQAVASLATSLGQALESPQIVVLSDSALQGIDEQQALAQLSGGLGAGPAQVLANPALALPSTFTVLENNGQLTLATGALGSGSDLRTLVLSTSSGGTLSATGLGAGVTATG